MVITTLTTIVKRVIATLNIYVGFKFCLFIVIFIIDSMFGYLFILYNYFPFFDVLSNICFLNDFFYSI
jgi:hypothetical protein